MSSAAPSSGGSGGGGSDSSVLTKQDGTRIDWKSLVMVAFGVLSTSFFGGAARAIGTVWQSFIIGPVSDLASLWDTVLGYILIAPGVSVDAAFRQTETWVEGFGVAAFVVALAFVVAMAYVAAEVRERL